MKALLGLSLVIFAFAATMVGGCGAPAPQGSTVSVSSAVEFGNLCDRDSDCPEGQLCCYPCGVSCDAEVPDCCHNRCTDPRPNGGCPLIR